MGVSVMRVLPELGLNTQSLDSSPHSVTALLIAPGARLRVALYRESGLVHRPKPDMTGSAYSITSSARARINGGIVRPSALVDDEIECGRLLNRKISRLSSLQGAVDIASGAAKDVEDAGAP